MADGRDINIRIKIDPDHRGGVAAKTNLASIGRSALSSHSSVARLGKAILVIGSAAAIGALVGAVAVVKKLAGSFLDAAREAENFGVRLKVLLGSAEEGARLFDEMAKFASSVPFEYRSIMESATRLSGVLRGGVDEIRAWMPLIGDLAAATGLSIEQATDQVIRMLSAGAGAADLFRERGVLAMLGFQAGVQHTAEESRKKLIEEWTKAGSQFRGATEELANTWDGAMSMISDAWFQFRTEVMDAGLHDELKSIANTLVEMAQDPAIRQLARDLGETLLPVIADLAERVGALGIAWLRMVAQAAGAQAQIADIIASADEMLARAVPTEHLKQRAEESRRFAEGAAAFARQAARDLFDALRNSGEEARGASEDLSGFNTVLDGSSRSASGVKGELDSLNKVVKQHQEEIRKSEERIREAQRKYREWTSAIEEVESAFDDLDILDITELLMEQGREIPDTAEGWRDLAGAISMAEAALDRYGSHKRDIPLDIEGELGGGVFPELDPEHFEEIVKDGEEKFGQLAKSTEAVMARAWENIQDIVADAIADIIKTGKVDFEALANAILDVFAQMLAKLLVMWAANAAKRMAMEQEVAATNTATDVATDVSTSGMSASGLISAIGPVLLAAAALMVFYKMVTFGGARDLIGAGSVKRVDGEFSGSTGVFDDIGDALIDAVHSFVRDFESATGSFIRNLPEIALKIQEGSDKLMVFIDGSLRGVFDTLAEAIDFGIRAALESADIEGLDPELLQALREGSFESLEQLREVVAILQEAGNAGLPDVTVRIREMLGRFSELARKLEEVGISASALGNLMARGWNQIRDSITGATKSARELFEERRKAFNAELKRERAKQEAALATAEAQAAAAAAEVARIGAMVAAMEAAGETSSALFARLVQQLSDAQKLLSSATDAAAAARAALDALPDPIGPGEFQGGRGSRKADRERLEDILREHDLSKLSDLQRALQGVNDKWDDAIKLAHGDAEAIERIARARQEEIQAIKDQAVDDFYGRLRRFERGPKSPLGDALSGVNNEQRELIDGARELAEALGFADERLATMIRRIRDAAQEQREAILGNAAQDLLLSALDFLGRGEEAERIRFEIQKAQLLIAYEELRVAATKYKIELDLLGTIGELIGEISDLDFDAWKRLTAPVRDVNRGLRNTNNEFERLASRLVTAKDNIRDFLNSLDRNESGGLSPKEALDNTMAQFEEILKAAKAGDINALEAFPSIGQDLLKIAREFYGSDPRFAEIFEMVRQAGVELLSVSQAREGNVIFDERFYNQQRQQTTEQQRTNSLMEDNNRLQRENQQLMRRLLAS